MRTIGKHWPSDAPRGDYQEMCDYCGVMWRRSQLRKDGAGRLVCPDEGSGLDATTLNKLNAAARRRPSGNMGGDL